MSIETNTQTPELAATAPSPDPTKPPCPTPDCGYPLDLQQSEPTVYRCAMCCKWFNEKLEKI